MYLIWNSKQKLRANSNIKDPIAFYLSLCLPFDKLLVVYISILDAIIISQRIILAFPQKELQVRITAHVIKSIVGIKSDPYLIWTFTRVVTVIHRWQFLVSYHPEENYISVHLFWSLIIAYQIPCSFLKRTGILNASSISIKSPPTDRLLLKMSISAGGPNIPDFPMG